MISGSAARDELALFENYRSSVTGAGESTASK